MVNVSLGSVHKHRSVCLIFTRHKIGQVDSIVSASTAIITTQSQDKLLNAQTIEKAEKRGLENRIFQI